MTEKFTRPPPLDLHGTVPLADQFTPEQQVSSLANQLRECDKEILVEEIMKLRVYRELALTIFDLLAAVLDGKEQGHR